MDPSAIAMLTPAQREKLPGMMPPDGVLPNFVNPPSLVPLGIAILTLCMTVTTILIAMRVYIRTFLLSNWGWDDATALVAWAGFVSYCAVGLHTAKYGDGIHQWNVHYSNLEPLGKLVNVQEIMYCPLMFLTKASILLLYLRIFSTSNKTRLAYVIHTVMAATFGLYFAQFFVTLLGCIPRKKLWNPSVTGHCINLNLALEFSGAFNVGADFLILFLPLHSIWRLQMPFQRKIQVSAVFAFGLFACVASIMRLVKQFHIANAKDLTYAAFEVGLWTIGELAGGLVCGSLPVIPSFFRWFIPFVSSTISFITHSLRGKSSGISFTERSDSPTALKDDWSHGPNSSVGLGQKGHRVWHPQSTMVRSGGQDASDETLHVASDDAQETHGQSDLEKSLPATPETGIQKTVRMETFPNSIPS